MLEDIEKEFLRLIEQHKGMIYKISKMYRDREDDREDLFQEIVMQLWRSYGKFKGESKFSTWMYRVSVNTALTFFRKEKYRKIQQPLSDHFDRADDHYDTRKDEQLQYFYKAVHCLNPVEKALIFLFLEGQSHREIGLHLGITEVNARTKLKRTKDKLQQIIKENGYEF